MAAQRFLVAPLFGCALAGLAAAGCSDGTKGVAEVAGLATTAQESKTFVRESRPAALEYIPVGSSITRQAPRKQVSDFKALEAELDAARAANEAAGTRAKTLGATPAPAPAKIAP